MLAVAAAPSFAGEFKLNGSAHYYHRDFEDTLVSPPGETSEVRRLRPVFEYRGEGWSARFMPDLIRETNQALDAYVDFTPDADWDLRIGRFKSSASIDQLKSTNTVAATETSMVASMTPNRDNGILFGYGGKDDRWRYELGVFDGAADDQVKGSLDGGAEWMTRIVRKIPAGEGTLRLGAGVSGGNREGEPGQARLARYQTPGRSTWFRYRGDAYADGNTGRVVAFADYYGGPVYAQLEAAQSRETVRLETERVRVAHRGWELQAGYVLTGDARTYEGVKPGNFVMPGLDKPVAVELTGRVGRVTIDDDAFDAVADPLVAGREAELAGLTLGLWFSNKWRLTSEFEVTRVANAATGRKDTERALIVA
ncbi:MAG TPA: porin, partial [Xanthomonadaceae bacterium]|nr:porin [Xanthomonadaceae bacterium]